MTFGVPFGAVQQVLGEVLGVIPERQATLLSRLRNMNRESFQPSGGVGRGQRTAYGVEQLTSIVFYNYMIDLLIPPDPATRLYVNGKASILHVVRETCLEHLPPEKERKRGPKTLWLRIRPAGLWALRTPLGTAEADAFSLFNQVEVCSAIEAANDILTDRGDDVVEVYDIGGVMWKVFAWLIAAGFSNADDLREALETMDVESGPEVRA